MKHPSHPRWPKKEPETLPELREHLQEHFDFLFDDENIDEVRTVLDWLKSNSTDILHWSGEDSFSTLFLPFHTGAPFMQAALRRFIFPDVLQQFLKICTKLEKTTDQFAYIKTMEKLKGKEEMISNLEKFLVLLPTSEKFSGWVQAIEENSRA